MLGRRLSQLVTGGVLVISGVYLLVYLYRWEWNRALVAGLFFVAAEVAIIGAAVLRRLRELEARLDAGIAPAPLDRIRETAPEPRQPFAWLEESGGSMSVFVPVLLGAGVVLSALAAVVERVAGVTARPVLEEQLAGRLAPLAMPAGGLLGPDPAPVVRPTVPWWRRTVVTVPAATLLLAGVAVGLLDVLADATQDRPDPPATGRAVISMEITRRNPYRDPVRAAEALFISCRHTLGDQYQLSGARRVGGNDVELTISPGVGKHARRRLVGCLQDARFDRVSAHVVGIRRIG
jgi:hypothetical protein